MLQAGSLQVAGGIGLVTAGARVVKHPASGGLLRVESKFRIAFAALHVAASEKT
jgi:hypothetical protein